MGERPEVLSEFRDEGYLLMSGLIPEETVSRAESAMWRLLGADRDDEASWRDAPRGPQIFEDADLTACYTPGVLALAETLSLVVAEHLGIDRDPGLPPFPFSPHRTAFTLNVFPQSIAWTWPGPHIDHALRADDHPVFPPPIHLATMIYLNDVEPHGGGTIVWPGSHRRIFDRAQERPAEYARMWQLNKILGEMDLGEPIELTPKAGQVLFYHYLLAHAGSPNTASRPRFAMNAKW